MKHQPSSNTTRPLTQPLRQHDPNPQNHNNHPKQTTTFHVKHPQTHNQPQHKNLTVKPTQKDPQQANHQKAVTRGMVSRETSTDLKHDKSAHSTVRETRFHSSKPQQPIPTNQPKQTSMFHVKHQPQQLPEKKQRSQTTNSRTDQPHNVSRGTISVIRRSLLNPGSRRVFGDSGVSRETRQDGSTLFQETRRKRSP